MLGCHAKMTSASEAAHKQSNEHTAKPSTHDEHVGDNVLKAHGSEGRDGQEDAHELARHIL